MYWSSNENIVSRGWQEINSVCAPATMAQYSQIQYSRWLYRTWLLWTVIMGYDLVWKLRVWRKEEKAFNTTEELSTTWCFRFWRMRKDELSQGQTKIKTYFNSGGNKRIKFSLLFAILEPNYMHLSPTVMWTVSGISY